MEPVPDTGETGFIMLCGQGFSWPRYSVIQLISPRTQDTATTVDTDTITVLVKMNTLRVKIC